MPTDPAETLLKFFPREMLNFDVAPPGTTIGPLHAIFQQVGQVLGVFQSDALLAQAQMSVQQAAGSYLDQHGIFYGLVRQNGETDTAYRARILLAMNAGKLTISAIQAAVAGYYATGKYGHIVTVYDRQSNPPKAAAMGLVPTDFVIDIVVQVAAADVFFAGRSYAGRNTFVVSATPYVTDAPADKGLVGTVNRTKAAGTHPIYVFTRVVV